MELFATDNHFIVVNGDETLWIDRLKGGACEGRSGPRGMPGPAADHLGTVYGYVGKFRCSPTSDTRVVFIRQQATVGVFRGHNIFRACSVVAIPLEGDLEVLLEQSNSSSILMNADSPAQGGSIYPTSPSHTIAGEVVAGLRPLMRIRVPPVQGLITGMKKVDSKVERRMLEEFHKMFTEAESFYYSPTYDITNCLQRQKNGTQASDGPLWEMADERFFWNRYMLRTLINSEDKMLQRWILPIIQGFIQCERCDIEHVMDPIGNAIPPVKASIELWLISRRSRFRAGTRYIRRGIDEEGKVANYVETEQIVEFRGHLFSFVQVRGSIPVFWSQANSYKYRPPPKIERDEIETYKAFSKHVEEELNIFERVMIVNLVEKNGKEKVIGDAYVKNILQYNSDKVVFVSFDFHNHCRGMRFENISILTDRLQDHLRSMGYCWLDSYGTVLQQQGVFRVNCVDCLDRTNVVQMHLAKEMLTFELSKVGLIAPEIGLPLNVKRVLQVIWANNGDTISKQYAGTNALKGDFTRTGERRFAGVMKDGMNSANRYYLNRFKDASRQATIDLMLGIRKSVSEAELTDDKPTFEKENGIDQVKAFIEEVKSSVVPPDEVVLGAWGLINARVNDLDAVEVDTVLVLTESNYYVIEYDCSLDSLSGTQKVPLLSVQNLELGFDISPQTTTVWSMFSGGSSQTMIPRITITTLVDGQCELHEFRSSTIRFFNNVAVPIQHAEEMLEGLKMIAETIRAAVHAQGKDVDITVATIAQKGQTIKGKLPLGSGIFLNKYLCSTQPLEPKKVSNDIKQITPSSQPQDAVRSFAPISESLNQTDTLLGKSVKSLGARLHLSVVQTGSPDLISFGAMTPEPVRPHGFGTVQSDLILPSCGILSPGRRGVGLGSYMGPPSDKSGISAAASPISPAFDTVLDLPSPKSYASNSKALTPLNRHRHSLPANSLSVLPPPSESPFRSKTPEITITEESAMIELGNLASPPKEIKQSTPAEPGGLNISLRRISKSSEDVNRVGISGFSLPLVGGLAQGKSIGFKLPSIISGSRTEPISPKNSNDVRKSSLQSSQRQALVFAPLGKLAKGVQNLGASYLDPRKLRDQFKTSAKQEPVDDKEIEERKVKSQTEFIDL